MSSKSEQLVVNAIREAAELLPLPPESRWIREPRRTAHLEWAVVVVALAFVTAVAGAIYAVRTDRLIPAAPLDAFVAADDAAWRHVREALPADVTVLRPRLLPTEFRTTGTSDCPSPVATWGQAARTYDVTYRSGVIVGSQSRPENSTCVRLEFSVVGQAEGTVSASLTQVGTIAARGTTIRVRAGTEFRDRTTGQRHNLFYLNWAENGIFYEISTFDLDIPTLTAIVSGLEPVR